MYLFVFTYSLKLCKINCCCRHVSCEHTECTGGRTYYYHTIGCFSSVYTFEFQMRVRTCTASIACVWGLIFTTDYMIIVFPTSSLGLGRALSHIKGVNI